MKVYNSFEDLKNSYSGENEFKCEGKIFVLHHYATRKGYQSVKNHSIENYNGRFGNGIVIKSHHPRSTTYHIHSYFIAKWGNLKWTN